MEKDVRGNNNNNMKKATIAKRLRSNKESKSRTWFSGDNSCLTMMSFGSHTKSARVPQQTNPTLDRQYAHRWPFQF